MYYTEEILPFLHNCCGTYSVDGDTGFSRFTQEQLDYYTHRSDGDFVRSHSPAGIYLECITDAQEISFSYRIYTAKGIYRSSSGIDIWEDDVFAENIPLIVSHSEWQQVRYRRRQKEASRIRIWFPNGVVFLPKAFSLGNAIPTSKRSRQILFYGDSHTESAYIPTPSLSWFRYIAEYLDAEYLNRGIGSMVFEADSLPATPDVSLNSVFIEFGGNDVGKTPDNTVALNNAADWITRMCQLYPTAEKYCILPNFYCPGNQSDDTFWKRLHDFCSQLKNYCSARRIHCISGSTLLPALPNLFEEDRVHFNTAGSAIVAANLICCLEKYRS